MGVEREAGMRWAGLCCYLLMAFCLAGLSMPLVAADLGQQGQSRPDHRSHTEKQEDLAEFCYVQRQLCRKLCHMRSRFEDRFDGCPSSCESREIRCSRTGCYRWTEPELVIGETFGAYRCSEDSSAGLSK
jgi:hypothetical protein